MSGEEFSLCYDLLKGQFGYKKESYVSQRPKKVAQAKVQRMARKVKTKKAKAKYKRDLARGAVRPKMRRQTGLVRVARQR
jgi:hypothetical protein|tara:strand:- start:624 stop:863 length:240 start_codon:yes stop_codon:yes gene_type:complete